MKVRNIENSAASGSKNNNYSRSNSAANTSFTGVTDGLIKFWEGVDRGGLAASFTVQDMLGTNIPRTWAARNVGKEYTGKNNWTAVLENGLREFLTGPSMFVVPGAVLYGSMRYAGKANGVPVQTIKDFGDIVSQNLDKIDTSSVEKFKETFYRGVLDKAVNNFDAKKQTVDVASYVSEILRMEKAPKKGLINNIAGKSMPDSREEILQGIVNTFVRDKKANTKGYPNFLTALITDAKDAKAAAKHEIPIDDLIDRMGKFSDDFYKMLQKSGGSLSEDFVKSFTNKRMGGRFATNIAMGIFTALAMWFIPRIYTIGKTNPETDPVRQKASELKGGPKPAEQKENNGEVSFSGGGISKLMSDLGEKVAPDTGSKLSKLASNVESDWINVARPIFYVLITCFTLIPRVIESTKRDIESSKKNGGPVQWDETINNLRRDVTTILTILFAMKGLGAVMAHRASKSSGIVLTNKILPDDAKFFDKFKNFLSPDHGVQVLSKKQNTAQMSSFANMNELMRFFRDTENKQGNLHKLLHIDAKANDGQAPVFYNAAKKVFGDIIEKEDLKADDLEKVLSESAGKIDENDVNELLSILNDTKKNPLLKFGNKINAIFETVSLAIVTVFLGFGLPKLNELLIKRKYLKDGNTLKNPDMQIPDYSILNNLKPVEKQTYQYFLGNMK
ncbi:TPA: hypothetical protein IAA68_08215 [Candidatus Galligastranaerophilus faecipullorum]|nr:hypothetical protein [Candidatus Galligastranaerophilus faecipullorum]